LDLKVNFLRPVAPDGATLTANAEVTHRGRSIAVVACEVLNDDAKKVAVATETILILPGRPWERPVYVVDEVPEWGTGSPP
jgi:acyl-coenzyme A thioesterase PaaI-like protein